MPKKVDLALLRTKYAAYRKKQTQTPTKAKSLMSFKAWRKAKGK